jgi:hypothetical protein
VFRRDAVLGASHAETGMYVVVHEDFEYDATTKCARLDTYSALPRLLGVKAQLHLRGGLAPAAFVFPTRQSPNHFTVKRPWWLRTYDFYVGYISCAVNKKFGQHIALANAARFSGARKYRLFAC